MVFEAWRRAAQKAVDYDVPENLRAEAAAFRALRKAASAQGYKAAFGTDVTTWAEARLAAGLG